LFKEKQFENSHVIADWKARVRYSWSGVALHRLDAVQKEINFGDSLRLEVAVKLNGLQPSDVVVEMLMGFQTKREELQSTRHYNFEDTGETTAEGENVLASVVQPEQCGKLEYHIRVYPYHDMLTHPFELGMMRWL